MATLQAARAAALGLPAASARSWGLNRAIYYAAAKRGFKGEAGGRPQSPKDGGRVHEYFLGDNKAYAVTRGGATFFTIGGDVQTPEAFERQIEARFAGTFGDAWKEAQTIVGEAPRELLESQEGFYMRVYRPRRDLLAAKWEERAAEHREDTPAEKGGEPAKGGGAAKAPARRTPSKPVRQTPSKPLRRKGSGR